MLMMNQFLVWCVLKLAGLITLTERFPLDRELLESKHKERENVLNE